MDLTADDSLDKKLKKLKIEQMSSIKDENMASIYIGAFLDFVTTRLHEGGIPEELKEELKDAAKRVVNYSNDAGAADNTSIKKPDVHVVHIRGRRMKL